MQRRVSVPASLPLFCSLTFLFLFISFVTTTYGQDLSFNHPAQQLQTILEAETLSFTQPDTDDTDDQQVVVAGLATVKPGTRWLVQVQGPITLRWKSHINQYLQTQNTELGHYYPHNTFLVKGPGTSTLRKFLRQGPGVLNVVKYADRFKTSKALRKLLNGTVPANFKDITIRVQLFSVLNPSAVDNTTILEVVVSLQAWINALASNLTDKQKVSITIKVVSNTVFQITFSRFPVISRVVTWLAKQLEVLWLEIKTPVKTNNFYAGHVVQGDNLTTLPLHQKGLKGDGIIIGQGDTGIDYDQCFFRDPNMAVPINTYNPAHRKIVYYYPYQGNGDASSGHGTHVAGTLAGSVYDPTMSADAASLSQWNGVAPNAKLAFVQLGYPGDPSGIYPPDDLQDYYGWLQNNGHASISSNSWGGSSVYDDMALSTDKFAWDNPNFLIVFCAGNAPSGQAASGYGSVRTPGTSKNGISVGASLTLGAAFQNSATSLKLTFNPGSTVTMPIGASYGPQTINFASYQNLPARLTIPADGCNPISNDVSGAFAVIKLGNCPFTNKSANAQAAGAVFVVVINTDDSSFTMGASGPTDITISSVLIGLTAWNNVVSAAGGSNNLGSLTASLEYTGQNEWEMAEWSNRGPTSDGRFKPDLVAPGQSLWSAMSDGDLSTNTCSRRDLTQKSGTSMATPVVSGMAAIVQEYFIKGYYPSGIAGKHPSITPTSALVKAVLIASGVSMAGADDNGNTVLAPPDYIQGFGRIQLDTALNLGQGNKRTKIWQRNKVTISTGGRQTFCFKAFQNFAKTSDSVQSQTIPSLRATLVWTDYYPASGTGVTLVNNLDLAVVKISNGKVWTGNTLPNSWDVLNNVEQVSLGTNNVDPAGGYFAVIVSGTNVPMGPQAYALVVNGNITKVKNTLCPTTVYCPNKCGASMGWGTCNPQGVCVCNPGHAGEGCGVTSPSLSQGSVGVSAESMSFTTSGTIRLFGLKYFSVTLTGAQVASLRQGLNILLSSPKALFSPEAFDVFVASGYVPSITKYQYALYATGASSGSSSGIQSWSLSVPKTALPSSGGQINFALYAFCCSASYSYTITLNFN